MHGETLNTTPTDQEATPPMPEEQRRAIVGAPVAQLALTQFTLGANGEWERTVLQEASYTY